MKTLRSSALLLALPVIAAASSAQSIAFTTRFGYDSRGRLESIRHPDAVDAHPASMGPGRTQRYTFNAMDGHDSVTYDGSAVVASTSWGAGGKPTHADFAPYSYGSCTLGQIDVERSYDALDRLRSLRVDLGGTALHREYDIDYDDWGFVERLRRADLSLNTLQEYDYDSQGRLEHFRVGGAQTTYGHDARGNLLTRSSLSAAGLALPSTWLAYDLHNQVTLYGYDASGRLEHDILAAFTYDDIEWLDPDGQEAEPVEKRWYDDWQSFKTAVSKTSEEVAVTVAAAIADVFGPRGVPLSTLLTGPRVVDEVTGDAKYVHRGVQEMFGGPKSREGMRQALESQDSHGLRRE